MQGSSQELFSLMALKLMDSPIPQEKIVAGIVVFQRQFRGKREKLAYRSQAADDFENFLVEEVKAFENLFPDDFEYEGDLTEPNQQSPVTSRATSVNPPHNASSLNGEESTKPKLSNLLVPPDQSSRSASTASGINKSPLPPRRGNPEDDDFFKKASIEEFKALERVHRYRIQSDEVFDRTYLGVMIPQLRDKLGFPPQPELQSAANEFDFKKEAYRRMLVEADEVLERKQCKKLEAAERGLISVDSPYEDGGKVNEWKSPSKRSSENPTPRYRVSPLVGTDSAAADVLQDRSVSGQSQSSSASGGLLANASGSSLRSLKKTRHLEPIFQDKYNVDPPKSLSTLPKRTQKILVIHKGTPRARLPIQLAHIPPEDNLALEYERMLKSIYGAYNLELNTRYRMLTIDFFDAVAAVGATVDSVLAKSGASENASVPYSAVWRDEHLFTCVETWIDQQSAQRQAKLRRDRSSSRNDRPVLCSITSDGCTMDWISLGDCCVVLVNGLINAHNSFLQKSKNDASLYPIEDWASQFVKFGLNRLFVDQKDPQATICRSVFAFLCFPSRRRLHYVLFDSVFRSGVNVEERHRIDKASSVSFASSFFKRQGITYLPFSIFLREACRFTGERGARPSLRQVRKLLDPVFYPDVAASTIPSVREMDIVYPVKFVEQGADILATVCSSHEKYLSFLESEPLRAPKHREGDKSFKDVLRVVIEHSFVDTVTHGVAKCITVLVIFFSWIQLYCGEGDMYQNLRFSTQHVFSEIHAYFKALEPGGSENDLRRASVDIMILFYDLLCGPSKDLRFINHLSTKTVTLSGEVQQLQEKLHDSILSQKKANLKGKHVDFPSSEEDNFLAAQNGTSLLRNLIEELLHSVGPEFLTFNQFIDQIVAFYENNRLEMQLTILDDTLYQSELAHARNPYREMDTVAFYCKSFNRMVDQSMEYLQVLWSGMRWLRKAIHLSSFGHTTTFDKKNIPQTFSECSSLLKDCISVCWPHQRTADIPFYPVQVGSEN